MTVRRFTVAVTTDGDGAATEYTQVLSGKLISIRYVKAGSGNFTDGVDFTITAETSGETLWAEENVNASKSCYPRGATASVAGAASLYASGGEAVNDRIALGADRVKIVVASGGAAKTGTFHVVVDS